MSPREAEKGGSGVRGAGGRDLEEVFGGESRKGERERCVCVCEDVRR